jgi:hypothetical protein
MDKRPLLLAMVATPAASAGVDNGGCPPERPNLILMTSYRQAFDAQLAAAEAAGITVEEIAEIYGVVADPGESLEEAMFEDAYVPLIMTIDKNGDRATCVLDRWGFEKKAPWGANIVDNVLPH